VSVYRVHEPVHISTGHGGFDFTAGEHTAPDAKHEGALNLAVRNAKAEKLRHEVTPDLIAKEEALEAELAETEAAQQAEQADPPAGDPPAAGVDATTEGAGS
jgi:hypothetical protein